jgi:hypothetical protein
MENFMKRILYVFLMMTCSVSWAGWELIGGTSGYASFVDRATIRKKGAFVEMWSMENYFETQVNTSGKTYRSDKSLQSYDCNERASAVISLVHYSAEDGTGEVVYSGTRKKSEINHEPIVPGSLGEVNWKIACGRK